MFCVAVGAIVTAPKLTVKFVPLSEPFTVGPFEITLIRYPVPVAVFAGMVADMVPELALLTNVPIFVGAAKLPAAFDNCAVYVFPVNVPTLVKGTETDAPVEDVTQYGLPAIADVAIVFEEVVPVTEMLSIEKPGLFPEPETS